MDAGASRKIKQAHKQDRPFGRSAVFPNLDKPHFPANSLITSTETGIQAGTHII